MSDCFHAGMIFCCALIDVGSTEALAVAMKHPLVDFGCRIHLPENVSF